MLNAIPSELRVISSITRYCNWDGFACKLFCLSGLRCFALSCYNIATLSFRNILKITDGSERENAVATCVFMTDLKRMGGFGEDKLVDVGEPV